MSLQALPTEIHLLIFQLLPLFERQILSSTNRYFHCLVPPRLYYYHDARAGPEVLLRRILDELSQGLAIAPEVMCCNPCQRLHLRSKFDSAMHLRSPEARFCIECGSENLWPVGDGRDEEEEKEYQTQLMFHYPDGDRWMDNGVAFKTEYCQACAQSAAKPVEIDPGEDYEDYKQRVCSGCLKDWVEIKAQDTIPGQAMVKDGLVLNNLNRCRTSVREHLEH